MNDISTLVNKFGGLALAITGTAVAAIPQASNISSLPLTIFSGLLTSIAGNKITELELINRLKNIPPEKLNKDIIRVSKSAVKLALKATIDAHKIEKSTCKKLKKKVDEICKQLEDNNVWNNIADKEIIDYESYLSENTSKLNNIFASELKGTNDNFENDKFYEIFQRYFHLFFGEYLKKDRPAYIAYEREMQKMIFNAVNELKISLDSQNISLAIKEGIAQYIKEIPVVAVNSEMQEEIKNEFRELKKYFELKEIVVISRIDDKVHFEGHQPIDKDYEKLQEFLDGKYQFKYNGNLYYVNELSEQIFDYLAGKIKYNQLFTRQIIEEIKGECSPQYASFYERIAANSQWDATSSCASGQRIISENFMGKTIGLQLDRLFRVEKDNKLENKTGIYIEQCRYIVNLTLDLLIFAFLSQLWDDVCKQKIELSENPLRGFYTMEENQIDLLRKLIQIYQEQKTEDDLLLVSDVLAIADQLNEGAELYTAITGLEKFGENPTTLDCYFAEKHLTVFFRFFRFLVNYKIVSMKKIEYFNIKNVETKYLHHQDHLKFESGENQDIKTSEKKTYDICNENQNTLFTYAVLLYKGSDYTKNINLFPFVIDHNALTFNKQADIAFFRETDFDNKRLKYIHLENKKEKFLKYDKEIGEKTGKKVIYLTDEEMATYNINVVYAAFEKIDKQLFI